MFVCCCCCGVFVFPRASHARGLTKIRIEVSWTNRYLRQGCCLNSRVSERTFHLSADIAVVEMTDAFRQLSLFYHLGVRESFSMANNIILYCDTNSDSLQSLQVSGRGPSPGP